MKKCKCPVCGNLINSETDEVRCDNCNTFLDKSLFDNDNPLSKKKLNIINQAKNLEFKKIIDLDYDENELIFAYYKMFANIMLNNNIDKGTFFNKEHNYTVDDLDHVILHMLEHNKFYTYEELTSFINKYAPDNETYKLILKNIMIRMDERIIEKDLREELFPKTQIPKQAKKYNSRKEDGKAILILGIFLMFIFPTIVFIFFKDNLKYEMFNIFLIVPLIFITSGLSKLILKKSNILVNILIFIFLYYFLTLLYGFSYMNIETNIFFDHLKGIGLTPYEIIKTLIDGLGE